MNCGKPMFAQIVAHLPERKFRRLVEQYGGNRKIRTFSCWDQLLCMLFAQLTYRESLRDIESCLRALGPKLYHLGIHGNVSRTNLARANESRDWRIYHDLAQHLIALARKLYALDPLDFELKNTAYAFDSTTIDLCMSLFPWARKVKGRHNSYKRVIKLHTLLDIRGNIPVFIHFTDGNVPDGATLDRLPIESFAIYILDRGFFDLKRLYQINLASAFFIVRGKTGTRFVRAISHPKDTAHGIICDQLIRLTGTNTRNFYPEKLRRIRLHDPDSGKNLVFFTNNFALPATTIAKLYKSRWQIELFFKWIKQHLRIKNFYGTSLNAVKTQIWIAVAAYALIAILKKRLALPHSLYTVLQIISVSPFEKTPISQAFQAPLDKTTTTNQPNQLDLFAL